MKSEHLTNLEPTAREKGIKALTEWIKGGIDYIFGQTSNSLEFNDLEEEVTKADAALVEDPDDLKARLTLTHAAAVYRDSQYAHAGRKYMLALGAHNSMRSEYE